MKKTFLQIILPLSAAILFIFLNACNKDTDPNLPPTLEFKTGTGYISDTISTVGEYSAIKVGVDAKAPNSEDYLNTFTVSHAFDGGDIVQDSSRVLLQNEYNGFDEDISFITRAFPGKEVYYFTVTNKNGLVITKSITLNVQ